MAQATIIKNNLNIVSTLPQSISVQLCSLKRRSGCEWHIFPLIVCLLYDSRVFVEYKGEEEKQRCDGGFTAQLNPEG